MHVWVCQTGVSHDFCILNFRELPNPQLELFDLDEAFSSEKARLAQITNKCGDEDVEYFVRESADILGITSAQVPNSIGQVTWRLLEFGC